MGLFSSKTGASVALFDINASSVAGAYVLYTKGQPPILYYTVRESFAAREGETITDVMLRTLESVAKKMVLEGAPLLRELTGSGHPQKIVASVAAPWQETRVSSETIEHDRPFTFSRSILDAAAEKARARSADRIDSGTTVIATILNGYETAKPFGKKASRASIVMLSSTIIKGAALPMRSILERAYHTHEIEFTGWDTALYTVFRDLYPHQKDFLILDVSSDTTNALFVKHSLLVDAASMPRGIRELLSIEHEDISSDPLIGTIRADRVEALTSRAEGVERAWIEAIIAIFGNFAKEHALPRTIFIVADSGARNFLTRLVDNEEIRKLWLSDEPLSIVPTLPEQIAPYLQTRGKAEGDLSLAILTLSQARKQE